jgi:RNA 2',3'-cyclic 3'-phosphodiesterase
MPAAACSKLFAHGSLLVFMRLFIALDIDEVIRERIARFMDGVRGFAPDARWMRPESLHVTLKFIGEQPAPAAEKIKQELGNILSEAAQIQLRGYGFFPTAKSPRVFWLGMEASPQLAALAAAVDASMASLGIPKEDRAFSPHLTLARGAGGSGSPRWRKGDAPNRTFHQLQQKLSALSSPEFGTMTPREFFLYQSQLSPKGSKYTKLASFALK